MMDDAVDGDAPGLQLVGGEHGDELVDEVGGGGKEVWEGVFHGIF